MLFFPTIRGKLGVIRSIQELIFMKCLIYFFFALLCDLCGKGRFTSTFYVSYPFQPPARTSMDGGNAKGLYGTILSMQSCARLFLVLTKKSLFIEAP